MSANDRLIEQETRHAIFVQRYGGGVYNDLKPVLRKLRRDLVANVSQAPAEYRSTVVSALLTEADALVVAASTEYGRELSAALGAFAAYEAEFEQKVLSAVLSVELAVPTQEVLAAIVTQAPARMVERAETIPQMVARFTNRAQGSVRLAIQSGYVEGRTVQQMVREVSRLVSTRIARQAESLVRTSVNHIGSVARAEVHKMNSDVLEGERYSATLDSRTTITCAGFDGKVFPLGEGPMPPLHYNCRSVRVPQIKKEFQIPGFDGERASVSGPVSAKTTYNGFLRNQSREFQDEVLGRERADLFRAGMPVDKFTDDAGRVLSLSELQAREAITLQ